MPTKLKVLFIGGTGNISTACTRYAISLGYEIFQLNRGNSKEKNKDIYNLHTDINNKIEVKKLLKDLHFDVVVNFIAFDVNDIERDYELFKEKTRQYIFISSTSAYQKPLQHPIVTETTHLSNPYWEYSRKKIEAELKLNQLNRENGFPATIVRPSLTYEYVIPVTLGGWKDNTLVNRIKAGKAIVVHGDGSSLWTITHSSDFAKGLIGLFGNTNAIGQAFHITSDEILTWNQIYESVAEALNCKAHIVHVTSDKICEIAERMRLDSKQGTLLGDKSVSVIFDNSKIKSFVPEFKATIPFREGIKKTIEWFEEDPSRYIPNPQNDLFIEELIRHSQLA